MRKSSTNLHGRRFRNRGMTPSLPVTQKASSQERQMQPGNHQGTSPSKRAKLKYSQSGNTPSNLYGAQITEHPRDSSSFESTSDQQEPSRSMQNASAYDVEDDDLDCQPAISSVHELRRSGANNRFSDELDDLLTRIGSPDAGSLTMRRNALCELAQRLTKANFVQRFRDHAHHDNIARGIGREADVVCGFYLSAAIVIFLKLSPAPHLVQQLIRQDLGKLIGRLLRIDEDIDIVAARRGVNMSRTSMIAVRHVKDTLIEMPIWHGLRPAKLSPRTLALQLLETVSRCSEKPWLHQSTSNFVDELESIALHFSEAGATDDIDFAVLIYSLGALFTEELASESSKQDLIPLRLPEITCIVLKRAVQRWPSDDRELGAAILKLAINTTNTEKGATAFGDPELLSLLANCIGRSFRSVEHGITNKSFEENVYDELLLILGVTINIMEHSPQARTSIQKAALDELIVLWQGHRLVLGEAYSVNESKVSVATSYLSILLGYICLTASGRARITSVLGDDLAIPNLTSTIRHFISLYRAMNLRINSLEALVVELSRSLEEQEKF